MQVERICFQSSCVINTVKYVQIKSVMLTRIFNPGTTVSTTYKLTLKTQFVYILVCKGNVSP